jgi:cold shock CspA family protein
MRLKGRITDWNDDRGFGFIIPSEGNGKVFLHVSALARGQPRPSGHELVTYDLVPGPTKGPRARNVVYVGPRRGPGNLEKHRAPRTPRTRRRDEPGSILRLLFPLILLGGLGLFGWEQYARIRADAPTSGDAAPRLGNTTGFRCEGKRRCREMVSCEEARFYLQHCPSVEIDGDGDGIPCERQWCGH